MNEITRRKLLGGAAGLAAGSLAALAGQRAWSLFSQPEVPVGVYAAPDYDEGRLVDVLTQALAEWPEVLARARGGRVVLKPNIVEFHPDHPINTDARFIAATVEAFRHHGASEVVVAEGPGHHRDTELLLELTGLDKLLKEVGSRYVDLNLDGAVDLPLVGNYTGMGRMKLAGTAVEADLLVSLAKLKTHHWAGATLTMKNLFGTFPGSIYGWPKNPLHWGGIQASIVDIWQALNPGFGIIDGVVGMEGDGPLVGGAVDRGLILMGQQLPAVDATACRTMGLLPEGIGYLEAASRLGGTVAESRIEVRGDGFAPMPFEVLPKFDYLRAG